MKTCNICFIQQILERHGEGIVSPSFEQYVHQEAVNFIENICHWIVFQGIHRTIVSFSKKIVPGRGKNTKKCLGIIVNFYVVLTGML